MVDRISNHLEEMPGNRSAISDRYAPSAEARAILDGRRSALAAATGRADPDQIKRMVSVLRMGLPSAATNEEGAKAILGLNVAALEVYPEWAIGEACRRFNDGTAGSGTFAPSPADLAKQCRAIVAPVLDEAAKLDRILNAEVYAEPTPEQKTRIADGLSQLLGELRTKNDLAKLEEIRRREERAVRAAEREAPDQTERVDEAA